MSYCINPHCQHPYNSDRSETCSSCGTKLLLKDRYRALQVLGQSTIGRTLLAQDLDKPGHPRCVIKQYYISDIATENSIKENVSYLDAISKNPRLPDLLANFTQDNYQYIIQEYIEGTNLVEEVSQKGVFSEAQVWETLREILPILQILHDSTETGHKSLVHRDIKPANIIRRSQAGIIKGKLALVDLGTVGLLKKDNSANTIIGAAEYSAPEQLQGNTRLNSDIYSLGVTCLYLLTKVSPFDLYDVETETWVWRKYLKQPVSKYLGHLLDKMVAREPEERYQSVAEVLKDVKHRPSHTEILLKNQSKYVLSAWGGAVAALLAVIIGANLPLPSDRTGFTPEVNKLGKWSQSKGHHLIDPWLIQSFDLKSSSIWSIAIAPNGRTVFSGNADGTISILDLSTGETQQTLTGHIGPIWSMAISANGKYLASGGEDGTIKIWDLGTGLMEKTLIGHNLSVFAVAWSPDSKMIASGGKDQTIKLWSVDTGLELNQFQGHTDEVQTIAWSPDSQMLASGSNDGTVKLWNWQNGELLGTLRGDSQAILSIAWHPDGRTLATGSWDKTIKIWQIHRNSSGNLRGCPRQTLHGHTENISSLAFSPDRATLASGDSSGAVIVWDVDSGSAVKMLKGHNSWVKVAFDQAGENLVTGSADDIIKVWQMSR